MSNAVAVTDADFEAQVEKHAGLTVVDFWATWCGPCRMIAPILDQLATEYDGKVRVAKLDVDSNQKTTMRFNVRSIPAMLFFKDGNPREFAARADGMSEETTPAGAVR